MNEIYEPIIGWWSLFAKTKLVAHIVTAAGGGGGGGVVCVCVCV